MCSFIKNREKEYLKRLFEKRFKIIPNISNEKSSQEFFSALIDEIDKQYQIEVKKSDEPLRYIEKERIRLRANTELLRSQDFDMSFKYLSGLYSIVIPIIVSTVGFLLISAKSIVDLAIQNKVEQLKNNSNITNINEAYDFLINIYKDYNIETIDLTGKLLMGGIFAISIFFAYMLIRESIGKESNKKKVAFERMCLDILENIRI